MKKVIVPKPQLVYSSMPMSSTILSARSFEICPQKLSTLPHNLEAPTESNRAKMRALKPKFPSLCPMNSNLMYVQMLEYQELVNRSVVAEAFIGTKALAYAQMICGSTVASNPSRKHSSNHVVPRLILSNLHEGQLFIQREFAHSSIL
ncbi:unnamed protein product [Anisakis simplex]|uniref:Pentatricopeptide repeat-containing protein n=1 Tax=Anisakis simplex TaxID=6269 RepID=A0A0M3IZK0_ANISI|nr:unnamed protein product [Anisakis simplex]